MRPGLGIFTAASFAAELSGNVETLIASRAIQGVGAALLTPTTLAIISAAFTDKRERNVAVGIWGAVGALALAAGPRLGGLLSEHVAWEWIFFINIPLGVVTAGLAVWAIDESRHPVERRLDLWGLRRLDDLAVGPDVRPDRGQRPPSFEILRTLAVRPGGSLTGRTSGE